MPCHSARQMLSRSPNRWAVGHLFPFSGWRYDQPKTLKKSDTAYGVYNDYTAFGCRGDGSRSSVIIDLPLN
ncbi:hypothetical protein GP2143_11764 [marine gamma proteobacterium HTCC2143]|uniref:Uncharacterized protein n=1 Tax=marine gamma proteobacterium HTCC2143 TaxID=247633 RepID=A0YGZ9_9GAMM|nr:hypothetical protein GP2143_11764 [marine gamma proteobacterium HTCC2143]